MMRIIVDLPAPLGPSNAKNSPRRIAKLMPRRASSCPYRLRIPQIARALAGASAVGADVEDMEDRHYRAVRHPACAELEPKDRSPAVDRHRLVSPRSASDRKRTRLNSSP